MVFVAILIGVAILAAAIWYGLKKNRQLVGEGKIISRKPDFAESAEIFTLNVPDFSLVTEGVKSFNYGEIGTDLKGSSTEQRFNFTASSWGAKLFRTSGEEEPAEYRFEFTNWSTRNGIPTCALQMNMLLTAVEKLFLSIDGNAQVRSRPLELKTKHHLF